MYRIFALIAVLAIGASSFVVATSATDRTSEQINIELDDLQTRTLLLECRYHNYNCQTPTPIPTDTATSTATETATSTSTTEPTATTASIPTPEPDIAYTAPLNFEVTFRSIGFEAVGANDGEAQLRFRASGETTWRTGLPAWYAVDAYYGSALLLEPGTAYDVRVITPNIVYGGQVATRTELDDTLPVPVYTLGAGGDYATLQETFQKAPPGAIVRVLAGSYAPTNTIRNTPITLIGDPGAVVEPQTVIAAGAWTQVTMTGPATGQQFTLWKAVSQLPATTSMIVEAPEPYVVAWWQRDTTAYGAYTMTTPDGWAEVLHVNQTYNYGFAAFGSDIYLRLPGDADPNTHPIRVHYESGYDKGKLAFNGANTRINGITFNGIQLLLRSGADGSIIDDNSFRNTSLYFLATQNATPMDYAEDVVVEDNTFVMNGLYDRSLNYDAVAWLFIKQKIKIDGAETQWSRTGDTLEVTAIEGRGGAKTLVVRRNTIDGYFNGIGAYSSGFDRWNKSGYDVYDNTWSYIADDVFELDIGGMNWRVWNNLVTHSSIQVSLGPAMYGPAYLFRNQFLDMTNNGVGRDNAGNTLVGVNGFKYSGSSVPGLLIYVINNTFQSDDIESNGGLKAAGGAGNQEWFYLRNNIFDMGRYVFSSPPTPRWNEDYNAFSTTDLTRGLEYAGQNKNLLADYQAASGQGAHSNPHGDFHDPITPESLVDTGVIVPNIADAYNGAAPDIGATEQ